MPDWMPYLEIPVPAAQVDVEQAVALAQRPVPIDVQALLTNHQGESPVPEGVTLPNGGSTVFGPVLVVSATQTNTTNNSYSVSYAANQIKEWFSSTGQESPFFPFASNTASGWFCVDQRDPTQPIIFIDVEYAPTEKGAITPVAKSATELLQNLHG